MSRSLDCPERESWLALLDAAVPADQRAEYERHLESCPACQRRLEQIEESDQAMRHLGLQLGDPTRAPADATLLQVIQHLRATAGPDRASRDSTNDLYFLAPSDKPDVLGTLGAYEVQEVIGQGGMGVVLRAYEPALQRRVAIKVMAAAVAGSAMARQRFTREAQAAAAVCHEHIVAVHGVHEVQGLPYLVMQYVAGESLQERLDRDGALALSDVVQIGLQTASALAAAHAQGLIHRDIKPANLLLENGLARVKITDFGLARMLDDARLTQSGVIAGTPEYMAPEQARGEDVDARADLFSLGAVLYAMATGVPPFRGATAIAVLRAVNDETPPPLRTRNPAMPAWLEALVAQLLAKNPDERIQSAGEVAGLLDGYLAHLRQPDLPAPTLAPLWSAASRKNLASRVHLPTKPSSRLFAALSLAVLVLGIGLTFVGLQVGPAGKNPDEPAADIVPGAEYDIHVWNLAPLHEAAIPRLKGHAGPVHELRFTRQGRLVSSSADSTLRLWEPATGREVKRIPLPAPAASLALSKDGRFALIGLTDGPILHIDLETGQLVKTLKGHRGMVSWVSFDADEQEVYSTGSDGTIRPWKLRAGKQRAELRVENGRARGGALFPGGRRLITGDERGLLQIWDLQDNKAIKRLQALDGRLIDSVSLSDDGRQVLVAGIGGVRLYDLETGETVRRFQTDPEREEIVQAVVSPDGQRMLTANIRDGKVRLWNYQTGELLGELANHHRFAWSVAFSPDGTMAVSAGGDPGDAKTAPPNIQEAGTAPTVGRRRWLTIAGLLGLLLSLLGGLLYIFYRRNDRDTAGQASAADEGVVTDFRL